MRLTKDPTDVQAQGGNVGLDEAIAGFEQAMCSRAAEAAIGAAESIRIAFSPDGADAFAKSFEHMAGAQPS